MAYFPGISMVNGQRVVFNFGNQMPFRARQPYEVFKIQEPTSLIKSYSDSALFLVETLKRYVMQYVEFDTMHPDTKLMVGSIILEYLSPLLSNDPYLMEEQLV